MSNFKHSWLPEDLNGIPQADPATAVLLKHLPNIESPCLGLDLGSGDVQNALFQNGVQLSSANSLYQNYMAASLRSKNLWNEILGDEGDLPSGSFASGIFRLCKNTERNLTMLASLWVRIRQGGVILCYGPNEEGIKGFQHKLERAAVQTEIIAMGKGSRILGVLVHGDYPLQQTDYSFKWNGREISTPAGVFAAGKLDQGTKILLDCLPSLKGQDVVDLGCGCGVISLAASLKGARKIVAADNFRPAVRATQKLLQGLGIPIEVSWDFIGSELRAKRTDYVITNPPFHQEKKMNHKIGLRWLQSSSRLLREGGHVILVANRFLDYPTFAQELFSDIQEIGGDHSFRVLRMVKLKKESQEDEQWISINLNGKSERVRLTLQ